MQETGFGLLAAIPLAVIAISFIEYVYHRWVMHNMWLGKRLSAVEDEWFSHDVVHHRVFYGPDQFEHGTHPASKRVNIKMNAIGNGAIAFLVSLPLLWVWPIFPWVFAIVAVAHGMTWSIIHMEMHEPTNHWIFRNPVYRYLRGYHYQHHLHMDGNFNVVFPIFDFVFGTYKGVKCRPTNAKP